MGAIEVKAPRDWVMIYALCVKQNALWMASGAIAIVGLTLFATQQPYIFIAGLGVAFIVGIFRMVPGWWRRAYVLTILAMGAGASHISGVAQIGALAKILAIGFLLVATFLTTRHGHSMWASSLHKFVMTSLWLTAGLAILSAVWSESRAETVSQAALFVGFVYILHRVGTVRWQDRKTLAGDIGAAYWSTFVLLAVGAVLALVGFPEAISSYSGRHQGIFNNPNLLGMIAALAVCLGIGWAVHKRSILTWVSLVIPISQVILSESRTVIIATAVGIIWVVIRRGLKHVFGLGYLALTVVVAAVAFGWRISEDQFDRFTAMEGGDLLNGRSLAWSDVISYVAVNPLGIGWSATTDILTSWKSVGIGAGLSSVHNSYLQLIYELGWMGAVPVAMIVIALIGVVFRPSVSGLSAGLVAATMAGMLIQFTESAIFGMGQPYPYLFWFAVVAATMTPSRGEAHTGAEKAVKEIRSEGPLLTRT